MTFGPRSMGKSSLCVQGDALGKRYCGCWPADYFSSRSPPHSHLSFSSNRALRIVLAVRRDSYHHLSLRSLHLHRRPPKTAWPWIMGAACTQRGPSRALWKPAEQRTAPPTLPTASVLKWVPASSSMSCPHQVFALRGCRERECGGICVIDWKVNIVSRWDAPIWLFFSQYWCCYPEPAY